MPEYLAPGVYVEETSFRAKSIEGVSTTTTGFVGPTRYGPLDIEPEIVTSLVEFERTYGGRERLAFLDGGAPTEMDNFMWHAARAFFEEGGKRLYVSRVYTPTGESPGTGYSFTTVGGSPGLDVRARFPGRAGDARVTFTFNVGQNVLVDEAPAAEVIIPGVRTLRNRDVVLILDTASPAASPPSVRGFFMAHQDEHTGAWSFTTGDADDSPVTPLEDLLPGASEVRIVTVSVSVDPFAAGAVGYTEAELPLDPRHRRGETPDSLFDAFAPHTRDAGDPNAPYIANLARARTVPIVIRNAAELGNGLDVLNTFLDDPGAAFSPPLGLRSALESLEESPELRSLEVVLTGGDDGLRPQADEYEGVVDPDTDLKTGLKQFEDLEDISIVAAPGSTWQYEDPTYGPHARTIVRHLISHAQRMRYRIAVLDSGNGQSIGQVRAMRAQLDSTHAALYYPWVRVLDPLTQRETYQPPSGFVAGIYARNDVNRAVYKAPANEVVNLALGFERFLNKSQQEVLNPEGINCFRFFEGRGMRLWGARTISSDPEWKYVNLRRYFAYLERSIDKGTQWAVFEPNGEQLWANVRRTISDFLLNEWQNGALLGDKPEKAYFVKCDRSTMSQNDLDNGRLVCLIGVAPLRPAEFVIFRIGQWTADRRV
ncbi:MAG TPA: phage tail sheath subtilisin-like domain-containing protein [Longimicrobium sp.]|nr:phage tail sheath subtilisin-like domain-containing protein [Longimicrobium sp.]